MNQTIILCHFWYAREFSQYTEDAVNETAEFFNISPETVKRIVRRFLF